jgi:hypothetical protein
MKRMTDERLAYMTSRKNSLDLNEAYECVQALKAERAEVERLKKIIQDVIKECTGAT